MSATEDRVQEALAAHLEQVELGGPAPDVSHLTPEERERLENLIGLLDQTEGVAFGRGLEERTPAATASTEGGARLLALLRDELPAAARIRDDPAAITHAVPGLRVSEGWLVGTFGGRVRVWQVEGEGALDATERWLGGLARIFRTYPDTAAVALVQVDQSCLIISPEDCAPAIEVPRGSIVPRRYRRPIQPVGQALSVFFRELVPSWEPIRGMTDRAEIAVDVEPMARERAGRAIEEQVAAGGRARKTNPKRTALGGLGEKEAGRLAALVMEVHEGRAQPEAVEEELRRMAASR